MMLMGMTVLVGWGPIGCGPAGRRPGPGTQAEPTARLAADDSQSTYVLLRLSERRLYLMDGGSRGSMESFPIAIGRQGHDTPTGRFHVEEMV